MLFFKKVFFDAIADGSKSTTVRHWPYARVKPGSTHTVPRLGRVRIESVQPVELAELTDRHAKADGFDSVEDLLAALAEMYGPDLPAEGKQLYLIRFTFLQPDSA